MNFFRKILSNSFSFHQFFCTRYIFGLQENELEGIYVGLWPITILGFAIAIRQRRKD